MALDTSKCLLLVEKPNCRLVRYALQGRRDEMQCGGREAGRVVSVCQWERAPGWGRWHPKILRLGPRWKGDARYLVVGR